MTVNDFFQWGLPALLTGLLAVIWYLAREWHEDVKSDVKHLKDDAQECALRHEQHRSHVAENYAKKTDVQHSLDRIHSRLDMLPSEIIRAFRGEK